MAKRDPELSKSIAVRTNITKWTNAIEEATGGTKVNEVCGLSADDWKNLADTDKWNNIVRYKSEHPDIKLKRIVKQTEPIIPDFKTLAIQAANAVNEEERNKILDLIKKVKAYDDAKSELKNAEDNLKKAEERLQNAIEKLNQIKKEFLKKD